MHESVSDTSAEASDLQAGLDPGCKSPTQPDTVSLSLVHSLAPLNPRRACYFCYFVSVGCLHAYGTCIGTSTSEEEDKLMAAGLQALLCFAKSRMLHVVLCESRILQMYFLPFGAR